MDLPIDMESPPNAVARFLLTNFVLDAYSSNFLTTLLQSNSPDPYYSVNSSVVDSSEVREIEKALDEQLDFSSEPQNTIIGRFMNKFTNAYFFFHKVIKKLWQQSKF